MTSTVGWRLGLRAAAIGVLVMLGARALAADGDAAPTLGPLGELAG